MVMFLSMFTPTWKKNANLLDKAAKKFVNYKRDLLSKDRVDEIESRRVDLKQAIRSKDLVKVNEASKQLRATCEHSLPREKPQTWLEENVEVMFVAIVIALGLRAYYLQPFRIPTGSMQPTLNGIVGTPLKKEEWPSLPQRLIEFVLRGRSYEKLVAKEDVPLAFRQMRSSDGRVIIEGDVRDKQWMHFFSKSQLLTLNSKPLWIPAPATQAYEIGLRRAMNEAYHNGGILKKGQVLVEGFVDTGDLVLVDKISYHFRKPKRGEVFVFDTLGIKGIQEHSGPQGGGSHYIKRLVGVPGDELRIESPQLLVNGKIAEEKYIQKVAKGGGAYPKHHRGYQFAEFSPNHKRYLVNDQDVLKLRGDGSVVGYREYAAMGDNTANSLDSRFWGPVKEYNLVGPALFALWPITTGHWGFIR